MKQQIIDQFVISMLELLKTTKDFVVSQAPDVVREILVYSLWNSLLWASLNLIGVIIAIYFYKKVSKAKCTDDRSLGGFISAVIGIVFFMGFVSNLNYVAKIKLAPKLFLIEYLSELVKK